MAMGCGRALVVLVLIIMCILINNGAESFTCNATGATCNALVGYVSPNDTTLSHLTIFFGIGDFPSLLGANNLPLSTPPSQKVPANQTVNIPFRCLCTNGTGRPNTRQPLYKVVKEDGLWHIAAQVFSGLVTYQQIQEANNISDPNVIEVGNELWIPLPCSCDPVAGQTVLHYGHVVKPGSSVEEIALQYNSSVDTLLSLNSLSSPKQLLANVPFDVPLKGCTSLVDNTSRDYPLLVSNGTYIFTAANCVKCKCDAANNWILQCEPSQLNSSVPCPSMQCQSPETNLYIGNSTTSSGCNATTCAYAGYTNTTNLKILTTPASQSTCPAPGSSAPKFSLQGWNWSYLIISVHLVMLCLHFIQ